MTKTLMLGTAQWGWTVSRQSAFQLLDAWLKAGLRHLDCATNYPINRNPADFRAAERILQEYIQAHGLQDLRITMKLGSLDNQRSPEVNLAPSFVQMMAEEYLRMFDSNLHCAMFHWDNRQDLPEIQASLEALGRLQKTYKLQPGLSGIAHPEVYAAADSTLGLSFDIQLKHNILHTDLPRYAVLAEAAHSTKNLDAKTPLRTAGNHHFFAYGINAGGLKLEPPYPSDSTFIARGGQPEKLQALLEKISAKLPDWNTAFVRPPVKTLNHIGLIYAGLHPDLHGILLGVSSPAQLHESLDYWKNLETFDYSDVFSALKKILLPSSIA